MKTLDFGKWMEDYRVEIDPDSGIADCRPLDIGYDDPRITTHPNHIWTKLSTDCDCDGPDFDEDPEGHFEFWDGHAEVCPAYEEPDIFNGAMWVNRMEYYFSNVPWKDGEDWGVQ